MLGWASQPELDLVLSAEWPFEWCERWLVCGYRKKASFLQCRDANRAPIESCADGGPEVAAHRPRFVWAARNASGEDCTLHSTACRHQDSQESSGDDRMAPYRVQARALPHAIRTARSPKMAHAPGRGMAPFCRHRTIPGCPDAYRRCSARSYPRLMRGAPSRRTEAAARLRSTVRRSSPRTVEAARRPRFVLTALRASA